MERPHRSRIRGFSSMQVAAIVAAVLVFGSAVWKLYGHSALNAATVAVSASRDGAAADADYGYFDAVTSPAATSSTPEEVAHLGDNIASQIMANYTVMQQEGSYTSAAAASAGADIAAEAGQVRIAHPIYTEADITIVQDALTPARITRYQEDMAKALRPLANNTAPELSFFGYFVETQDETYLAKLRGIADDYRAAAAQAEHVAVPFGMRSLHVSLLNALQAFSASIDAVIDNAGDPITSTALLVSYNRAEDTLRAVQSAYTSFYASR
jgi:hypothetical protein